MGHLALWKLRTLYLLRLKHLNYHEGTGNNSSLDQSLKVSWLEKKRVHLFTQKERELQLRSFLITYLPSQVFLYKSVSREKRKKNQPKKQSPLYHMHIFAFFFSLFKVSLERTKGLELFNDIILGKYRTWGSILPPQRGFKSSVSECFLACRQSLNRENSVCSLKIIQNIPLFVRNSWSLNRK